MATTYDDSDSRLSFGLEEAIDNLVKANKKFREEMKDLCEDHNGFQSYIRGEEKGEEKC